MTPIWITIAIALVLAGVLLYGALREGERRAGPTITIGLFILAAVLAIIAIASVTFFRKAVGA